MKDADFYIVTISAVAEICGIFDASVTISPFATATSFTNNPILSTVAIPTSLPSITSTSTSRSSMDDIAGTSVSVFTTTGVPTQSGTSATSTTTNVAQRHDLSRSAIQGVAVALLGLALYL